MYHPPRKSSLAVSEEPTEDALNMFLNRRETLLMSAAAAAATASPAFAQTGASLSPEEARSIAKEALLWGMHPVAIYHLWYNQAQNQQNPRYTGINRLNWLRKPLPASNRVATTPNATTLYGT